jgi:hypothetical protein
VSDTSDGESSDASSNSDAINLHYITVLSIPQKERIRHLSVVVGAGIAEGIVHDQRRERGRSVRIMIMTSKVCLVIAGLARSESKNGVGSRTRNLPINYVVRLLSPKEGMTFLLVG